MSGFHVAATAVPYTHCLRVLFSTDGTTPTVVSVTRVAMRAPGGTAAPAAEQRTGYWLEMHGAQGAILYHRPLRDPLPDSLEVFDDPDGGNIRRVPHKRPKHATFEVIVPDFPDAMHLELHGPAAHSVARAASGILLRHTMDELRALSGDPPRRPRRDDDDGGRGDRR